jgi:hypothetical protein
MAEALNEITTLRRSVIRYAVGFFCGWWIVVGFLEGLPDRGYSSSKSEYETSLRWG